MANDKNETALFENTIFDGTEILWALDVAHLVRIDNSVKQSDCKGVHYRDILSNQKFHIKAANYDNSWCDLVGYNTVSSPIFNAVTQYMDADTVTKVKAGEYSDYESAVEFMNSVNEQKPKVSIR